jgi:pimeloyl-ACP methyl ester carboxylesterase
LDLRENALERPDGATIAYRVRPGRRPWVFLHGLGCDASMWTGVRAGFASALWGLESPSEVAEALLRLEERS